MSVTRNAYAGAPVKTTITSGINASDASIVIASATGWPTGAQFPVVLDAGVAGEEKALVTRSGTTLSVVGGAAGRGYDDTVGTAHASGAVIYPCITANELDDFNRHVSTPTTKGDLIGADASGNPVRLAVGTDHRAIVADSSTASGLAYTNVPKGVPSGGVVCQAVTQTGVGASPTDVTGMTVTFTALANRRYKITAFLRMIQRTSTGNIVFTLTDGAGTQITGLGSPAVLANAEFSPTLVIHETYSAGAITRKLRMQTTAGTVDSASAATSPALLIVEDVGPT